MSEYNKYLFGENLAGEAKIPEAKDIYADTGLYGSTLNTSEIVNSVYAIVKPNIAQGLYETSAFNAGIAPNGHSVFPTVGTSAYVDGILANAQSSLLTYASVGTNTLPDGFSPIAQYTYNVGLHGYSDFLSTCTKAYLNSSDVNAQSSLLNGCTSLTQTTDIGTYGGYLTTLNSVLTNSDVNEARSLYGAVLDSHIKPTAVHSYVDGTLCLKMFEDSALRMPYGGYSDHILKQTKDLFALYDQLSLLNAESEWLDSKSNNEFYQSLYLAHGEDFASYYETWSAQVKLKIQKVVAKVDRLYKYIVKLKVKDGTRRINLKRVFRTKVNLVFKNLDDAHPAELNYSNSVNALFLVIKYNISWKLTFNT